MRTDVKIGVVLSLVVVVAAGWYYLGIEPGDQAVPLAEESASSPSTPGSDAPPESPRVIRRDDSPTSLQPAGSPDEAADTGDAAAKAPASVEDGQPAPFENLLAQSEPSDDEASPRSPLADLLAAGHDDDEADAEGQSGRPDPADRDVESPASAPERVSSPATPRRSPTGRRTPAPQPGTRTHVVGRGDTVAILAEVYYGSQRYTGHLLKANPQVTDPTRLTVGTVLQIPPRDRAADTRRVAAGEGTYVVKSGDTFYGIARDVLGSAARWQELLEFNSALVNGDPKNLRPGQVLSLPTDRTTAGR